MSRRSTVYAVLMAIFAVFSVMTNTVGVKLFTFAGLTLPVSIFWFPLTFLLTDIVSELYGSKAAYLMVILGFTMNLVLLLGVTIGIAMPTASFYEIGDAYDLVFSPTWRLLFASMSAYLLAQAIDIRLFHFWKKLYGGKYLWLRNNGSTLISQLVDTTTVSMIFLYNNEAVFSGSLSELGVLILQIYSVKAAIAIADTPLFYLAVWIAKKFRLDQD